MESTMESALAGVRDLTKRWEAAYELAAERARKAEQTAAELRDRVQELEERVHYWKMEARRKERSRSPR